MMNETQRKYEFTSNSISVDNHELHEIRAIRDFGTVKKGDLGGFIEKEENLSHGGNCWVYTNALVFDNARVFDNGIVKGNTTVYDEAKIYGNSHVLYGYIREEAEIYGNALFKGYIAEGTSKIHGDVKILDNVSISGDVEISGTSSIWDNVRIKNTGFIVNSNISGNSEVRGYCSLYNTTMHDESCVLSGCISNINLFDDAIVDIIRGENDLNRLIDFNNTSYGKCACVISDKTNALINLSNLNITVHRSHDTIYVYILCKDLIYNVKSFKLQEAIKYLKELKNINDKEKISIFIVLLEISNYLLSL